MPRISDFPIKSNPSTSATLSGVDGGENVQIPVTTFAKPSDIPSLDGYVKRTELRAFSDALVAGEDADGNELTVGNAYAAERSQTAERLTVNAGSATQPVYFANGVPIATNLATVATSGSYNDLTDKPSIPSGGGSGGASIIYATEKPSTPQQAIYVITEDEVVKAEIYNEGVNITPDGGYCEIVDELPENPIVAIDMATYYFYAYYCTKDNEGWVYFDDATASAIGAPAGWLLASEMGVVISTSVDDMSESESGQGVLLTTKPKTRVYVPMPDGTFLELTSGIRTRFDEYNGTVSITEV